MRHSRLLVGTLAECDVVLDLGAVGPHACLLRISRDGWTVLVVAGDFWLGEAWLAPQQTRSFQAGDVLTLGEVAFTLLDDARADWRQIKLPDRRQPPAHQAGKAPSRWAWADPLRRWRQRRMGRTVALASVLLLGGAGSWMALASVLQVPTVSVDQRVPRLQRSLTEQAWASELRVQAHPVYAHRLVVAGYLPERAQFAALETWLAQHHVQVEHRWTAVDELLQDLSRRLGRSAAEPALLRYLGQGRFQVQETVANSSVIDALIRRALQDVVALQGVDLHLDPSLHPLSEGVATSPRVVRYARAAEAPGGVAVSGQPPGPAARYDVREVRTGEMPSVLMGDGARYFEGAVLPGGAQLLKVEPGRLVLRVGQEVRQIDTETGRAVLPSAGAVEQTGPLL